ncbi:MAG: hypothetical protein ABID63_18240 [Pseudomonadota bacterium]
MSITFPLIWPSGVGIRSIAWKPIGGSTPVISPFTGKAQVQVSPRQQWAASLTLPPIRNRDRQDDFIGFLLALNGAAGSFVLTDPDYTGPRGAATGSPVVDGAGQAGNSLAIKGFDANVTGILKRGDRIGLGSGSSLRMYRIVADADSDGDGKAVVDIWPFLRATPANETPVGVGAVGAVFMIPGGIPTWVVDRIRDHEIADLDILEDLR